LSRQKTLGQAIITAMFVWSALLCHFEASELHEQGNLLKAILYWFCGFTAVLGAFRFKIAEFVYWCLRIKKNSK